ncbi:MAG: YihY/virulence factor BrkB family protein [Candidatus Delongbacteria bacterium]|nr:YihY/virulence factor BrkB family protein [Candidatus Delongbacteria bacterium]
MNENCAAELEGRRNKATSVAGPNINGSRILWLVVFVNNFSQYNKLFGSIGTFIVVLIWIYIMSFAVILGFELNARIIERERIEEDSLPSGQ